MKKRLIWIMASVLLSLGACKKKDLIVSPEKDPILSPILPPEKAQLVFPNENEPCYSGTLINDQEVKINFSWSESANTESYTLDLKNLLTNKEESINVIGNNLAITVARNAPYSWYVISKSAKTTQTAKSNTRKFYVGGPGIINYAPYPAELLSPAYGEKVSDNTVDLNWKGSDPDNDVAGYDVYLGTNSGGPLLLYNDVKDPFVKGIAINLKGVQHYWKIVTKDAAGNKSTSEIYWFLMH